MAYKLLIYTAFLALASSCSALSYHVSRSYQGRARAEGEPREGAAWRALSSDPRVAILRLSGEGAHLAGERLREGLLRRGYAVASGLATERELAKLKLLGEDPLKSPRRKELGRALRVRAAIAGRVERPGEGAVGLRVELEWFDFEQDKVLWRARGVYEEGPLLRASSLEEAIALVVEDLLALLPRAGGPAAPRK